MSYPNGKFPDSALLAIPGGRLARGGAAESWNAGPAKAGLRPLGDNSSYRLYSVQVYYWNLYQSGRGNLAAYPGTSNHGWGTAVDLAAMWMRAWIDAHGAQYHWAKIEAMSEWWHVNYTGGWDGPMGFVSLKRGMKGPRVKMLQKMLRHAGGVLPHPKPHRYWPWDHFTGYFGWLTRRRVKRFQGDHHLKQDGVVGPRTWHKLRELAKQKA